MTEVEIEILYPCEQNVRLFHKPMFLRQFPEVLDYPTILEEIFAEWNRGSGSESQLFLEQNCRSLSVGDFVRVHDKWFQCEDIGWNQVKKEYVEDFQAKVRDYIQRNPDHIPFSATQAVLRNI
jgi:hypothetical protein